jgi:hypothetical protein
VETEFEYDGQWWLPNDTDDVVSGRLACSRGGSLSLSLNGVFRGAALAFETTSSVELLNGVLANGKFVTLVECWLQRHTFGPYPTATYSATFCYVGAHFATRESISFRRIFARFSGLEAWTNQRPFNIDTERQGERRVGVSYEPAQSVGFDYGPWAIAFLARYNVREDVGTSVTIDHRALLEIARDDSAPLDDFIEVHRSMQEFLSLMMGSPCYPLTIIGHSDVNKRQFEDGKVYYPDIEVIFDLPTDFPKSFEKANSRDMLFPMDHIGPDLKRYVTTWLDSRPKLQPVYNLYFATLFRPRVYLETLFLNIVQAVETYHRRVIGGKYMPDDDYRNGLYLAFKAAIPQDFDKSFKTSLLEGRLKYANEYSLRKRLTGLLEDLSDLSLPFALTKHQQDAFAEDVSNTRNYLTHYDVSLAAKAKHAHDLITLKERLRLILELYILKEIGVSTGELQNALVQFRPYAHVLSITS